MEPLFLTVLNMSVVASYVIAAVLLLRLLLKKAPRRYSYALWSAAAFRLCCPVSFSAGFSLFGLLDLTQRDAALEFVPENLAYMQQPEIHTGVDAVNAALKASLPAAAPAASVNPMQIWIFVGACVWLAGIAAMALYGIVSYLRLRRRLRTAVRLEDNVFASEAVRSPFVLGVLRPKIYLPYGLEDENRALVLTHEKYHLRHGDMLVRLFAFCLLALHWFNPLVWVAFFCMSRDMELRCDEKVLENGDAKAYSLCLLSVAAGRRFPAPGPLAFGETDVKGRIRHALKWKRPRRWAAAAAAVLCFVSLLACSANPLRSGTVAQSEALDGAYRVGDTLSQNILLSMFVPDGESAGLQTVEISGNQVKITLYDQTESAAAEVSTVSRKALVKEFAERPELTYGFEAVFQTEWTDSAEAAAELVVPAYDSAEEMVVYRLYDVQREDAADSDGQTTLPTETYHVQVREKIPQYTLYFLRGEPLWIEVGYKCVFQLERK